MLNFKALVEKSITLNQLVSGLTPADLHQATPIIRTYINRPGPARNLLMPWGGLCSVWCTITHTWPKCARSCARSSLLAEVE